MGNIEGAKTIIGEMVKSSCTSLFHYYGCEASFCGIVAQSEASHTLGAIDAGCDDFELSLILNIPFSILALSYPCQGSVVELPEAQLEDWLLELANQLMGKLKIRLQKQSFIIKLGLPDSYFDVDGTTKNALITSHVGYVFDVDGVSMECWLHVDIKNHAIHLELDSSEDTHTGEIEFF
jgi:hypothetical protein